jgi:anti-sigma regulatory factor (Ser/Thr protein kinase)
VPDITFARERENEIAEGGQRIETETTLPGGNVTPSSAVEFDVTPERIGRAESRREAGERRVIGESLSPRKSGPSAMLMAIERWTFPMGDSAPAMARSAATSLAPALPPERLSDIVLLVSELVTNSVRHAGLTPADSVEMRVGIDEGAVRVEVQDPGPGFVALLQNPHPSRGSGWGLHLVDLVADRWGVDTKKRETVAWFEIDL